MDYLKDAERYRKLREIAVRDGELETFVVRKNLDFKDNNEDFDLVIENELFNDRNSLNKRLNKHSLVLGWTLSAVFIFFLLVAIWLH